MSSSPPEADRVCCCVWPVRVASPTQSVPPVAASTACSLGVSVSATWSGVHVTPSLMCWHFTTENCSPFIICGRFTISLAP